MKKPKPTDAKRSKIMRAVRRENTGPEKIVRSILHKGGFRFRLHSKKLPGSPDIVLPKYKSVIFIHGCYWHRHACCRLASVPKNNAEYWGWKFKDNIKRDKRVTRELIALGWGVYVIWQCEIKKNPDAFVKKIVQELTKANN